MADEGESISFCSSDDYVAVYQARVEEPHDGSDSILAATGSITLSMRVSGDREPEGSGAEVRD